MNKQLSPSPTPFDALRDQFNRRRFLKSAAWTLGGLCCAPAFAADAAAKAQAKAAKARRKAENVTDYRDAVLVPGEPPAIAPGSYTIVALPDTQHYDRHPELYHAQTEWIARNHEARNIVCCLHLGDLTNNNLPAQWELAAAAMARMDGKVPYFMALGNHDYGERGGCADRTTLFHEYFPLAKYNKHPSFGGVYDREPERLDNSFHLLKAGPHELIVLCLEFGPRKEVIRWANEVMEKHKNRPGILVTHAYMYHDDTRYEWAKRGLEQAANPHYYKVATNFNDDVADGEELWNQLVSKHHFIMTLNGHVTGDGLGRLTSTVGERQTHQMLYNCQIRPQGGDGWLRLIEGKADGRTFEVCDYSPSRGERNESPQNRFTLGKSAA